MGESVGGNLIEHVEHLLEKEEAGLPKGVKKELQGVKENVGKLVSYVVEFEEKGKEESIIVKEAVSQIMDIVEEAEDVIDTFILSLEQQRKKNLKDRAVQVLSGHRSKMMDEVNEKMQGINMIMKDIYGRRDFYTKLIRRLEKEPTSTSTSSSSWIVEKDHVVGLEDDMENVINLLLNKKEELEVVSIIGMGGIGKTTLATKIYHHPRVKNHFSCRVWLNVSKDYDIGKLYKAIMRHVKQVENNNNNIGEGLELKDKIKLNLQDQGFLLVMDDVWDHDVVEQVRLALPQNTNKYCRILITSRNKSVAACPQNLQYALPLLSQDESWQLFCGRVFKGQACPSELESTAKEIVARCRGLPISLVILSSLLAYKERRVTTWSQALHEMDWNLSHHQRSPLDILALSYNSLGWTLKPCFLYLAIFPHNFDIPIRRLIQLWIAEGFIQPTNAEEVGEEYLAELINRSLLLLSTKRTDGGVKTCRLHDLFRLLCQDESNKINFLELCTDINIFSSTKPRRLSLHCPTPLFISSDPLLSSSLRSLHCFGSLGSDSDVSSLEKSHWKWLYQSFRLIRVLNLGRVNLIAIPDSIKSLIFLRYLRIESKHLELVPDSIGNLVNLQTLDFRYSFLRSLPAEIWKLQQLRHVYVYRHVPLSLPKSWKSDKAKIAAANNLQGLSTVALDETVAELIKGNFFPNLRKLGLCCVPNTTFDPLQLLAHLSNLIHLRTLKILGNVMLPNSPQAFPHNLSKITLKLKQSLNPDDATITLLSRVPKLQVLKLLVAGDRKTLEFNCDASGFPKLKCLHMSRIHIQKHDIKEDAMPCLQKCNIKDCTCLSDHDSHHHQVLDASSSLGQKLHKLVQKNDGRLRLD